MSRFSNLLALPSKIFTQPTFEITQKQFRYISLGTITGAALLYVHGHTDKTILLKTLRNEENLKLANKELYLKNTRLIIEIHHLQDELQMLKNANVTNNATNAFYTNKKTEFENPEYSNYKNAREVFENPEYVRYENNRRI